MFESIGTSIEIWNIRVSRKRLQGWVFESIRTSIRRRYGRVSKKGLTWTSIWINTDEYQKKIRMSIKERSNKNECLNQYGRVSKENTNEYQGKDYTDECLNQFRRVSKEDTN